MLARLRYFGGNLARSGWRRVQAKVRAIKNPVIGVLDVPVTAAVVDGQLEVAGWASAGPKPLRSVEVWLDQISLGTAEYGLERLDVLAARPWLSSPYCGFCGQFEFDVATVGFGTHTLHVYLTDERDHILELQREISVKLPVPAEPVFSYQAWIAQNEPSAAELTSQREAATQLSYQPLISLITPVYNPPVAVLQAMLDSVLAQTYPHWELCLADASADPEIRQLLAEYIERDKRIKLSLLAENAGIVGNSNAALNLAEGDFIGLLDHDDTLSPNALYEVVLALNVKSHLDFLYSDHDLLSEDGSQRHSPLFKPDWSPAIMLSANYLTHLTVIRRSIVTTLGGFQPATEGAQDWDLFWRVLEQLAPDHIQHIPKVLYHWRESAGSTASDIYRKPLAPLNGLHVIEEHLRRVGISQPRAYYDPAGPIRVSWPLKEFPLVSIIIPTKDKPELIQACVRSVLQKTSYSNFELIVVDTGSTDPAVAEFYEQMATQSRVKLLRYELPFNYSAVNNWAVAYCTGEVLVFLNNDTEVIAPDWLDEIVRWTQLPEIGLVGAKLLKRDDTIQHAGVVVGMGGLAGHIFAGLPEGVNTPFGRAEWYRDYLAVTAACLGVRRHVFEELGGFDEAFKLNGSDVALGLKARQRGYRVLYNPFVRLYHIESATHGGHNVPANDYQLSLAQYRPWLESGDPFFNSNLSYQHTVPTLHQASEPSPLEMSQQYSDKHEEGAASPN